MTGKTRPTRRPATIREVAATLGLSVATVARVVAGQPAVAVQTRARVLAAMAALGYQPNVAARTMRTNQTKMIGLLIPDMANQIFARVAKGLDSVLEPEGYMLFSFASNGSPAREIAFLQGARQRQMDGLVIALSDEAETGAIAEIARVSAPIVALDCEIPVEADAVYCGHTFAIETMVRQLFAFGHRRIALIVGPQNIRSVRERIAGYRRALTNAGAPIDEWLIRADVGDPERAAAETQDLLGGADPPTAILAAGGGVFCGAQQAIRLQGLSIPADVSLVGADDPLLGELASPPISVIDRDMAEVGRQAARLLLDRLQGFDGPPRRIMVGGNILLRPSIGPPRNIERSARG